jgi:glycosyltransferase involved in cell wall biosynthesis
MIDVIITTYNRLNFLRQTIQSLFTLAGPVRYRLSVIDDASTDGTREWLHAMRYAFHHLVLCDERRGIVPNFNMMWDRLMADEDYPYLCYLQDDLVSETQDWLAILLDVHTTYGKILNAGFSTAYDAVEHLSMAQIDCEQYPGLMIRIKRSTSMQNLLAEKSFWQSIGRPPELDADGKVRGFPNDGIGSDIDVWFTGCASLNRFKQKACSPTCLALQGKTAIAVPMLRHLGIAKEDSTWRQNRRSGF